MKRVILPAMIALLSIASTGCNNGISTKEDANKTSKDSEMVVPNTVEPMEVVENTVVEVKEKPSDEHFRAALLAFNKKENSASSKYIREGIRSFKKETAADKGKRKVLAEAAMKNLEGLDAKIEKGEVKDAEVLKHAFRKAEQVNIHRSRVLVNKMFIPEKQDDLKTDFRKVLARLKNSVFTEKGKTNVECEKVVKSGETIETKLNKGAKVTRDEMEDFIIGASAWLETH